MGRTIAIAGLLASLALGSAMGQGVTNVVPALPGVQPPVPAPVYTSPPVGVPTARGTPPKRIDSFGDRATGCLHSFPLEAGKGNNPRHRDAYVRSCAN